MFYPSPPFETLTGPNILERPFLGVGYLFSRITLQKKQPNPSTSVTEVIFDRYITKPKQNALY